MHAVFSFSLSVLPVSVAPFEVFGSPVVFKGSEKGSPTVLSKGRPWDNRMLPPVLTALCQHGWCDCTHTSSSHPLTLVHCSLLFTRSTKCGCANAHTQGSAHAHIHTYRNMCTTTVGPLLSDNHFTETNQAALLLKAHPFLTLHITEDPFWSGGCLVERKGCVLWRESIAGPGSHREWKEAAKSHPRWKISLSNDSQRSNHSEEQ